MEIHCVLYDTVKREYKIHQFADASKAMAALKGMCPLHSVSNMEDMPEDGLAICCCIKGDPLLASMPLVIRTPEQETEAQARCRQIGADVIRGVPFAKQIEGGSGAGVAPRHTKPCTNPNYSLWMCKEENMHDEDWALVNQLMATILENISDASLTPAFIAEKMNIGLRSLYRKLKAISDTSLTGIILQQRLEYTRQLLIMTRLSIKEICYKSGFSNQSSFYKHFTTKFGCTPRKFRETMKMGPNKAK